MFVRAVGTTYRGVKQAWLRNKSFPCSRIVAAHTSQLRLCSSGMTAEVPSFGAVELLELFNNRFPFRLR